MRALRVPVSGPCKVEDVKFTLDYIQSVVGGYIEAVHVPGFLHGATLYCNEEGKLNAFASNPRATSLFKPVLFGSDYIAGDVVIVGPPDRNGEDTPVDPYVVELARIAGWID